MAITRSYQEFEHRLTYYEGMRPRALLRNNHDDT